MDGQGHIPCDLSSCTEVGLDISSDRKGKIVTTAYVCFFFFW